MYLSEVLTFHSRSNELESLQYYPSIVDTRDLLPTMIADLIFNSFLTYIYLHHIERRDNLHHAQSFDNLTARALNASPEPFLF